MARTGRPSEYTGDKLVIADLYLIECNTAGLVPYIEELSFRLDCDDETITEWAKKHEDFSATIKKVKKLQEMRLKQLGLSGKANPAMAIFLLKANHGLIKTSRTDITSLGEKLEGVVIYKPEKNKE